MAKVFYRVFKLFPYASIIIYIEFPNVVLKLTLTIVDNKLQDWIAALNDELPGIIDSGGYCGGHVIPNVLFPCIR